jgi:hypothetical protein
MDPKDTWRATIGHSKNVYKTVLTDLVAYHKGRGESIPKDLTDTLRGFEITQWWGMVVPAKTPRSIVRQLNGEIDEVLKQPELRERLTQQGAVLEGGTPERFAKFIAAERIRLGAIIRQAGITLRD